VGNGSAPGSFLSNPSSFAATSYTILVEKPGSPFNLCEASISVSMGGTCIDLCMTEEENEEAEAVGPDVFRLCSQVKDPVAFSKCLQCSGGEEGTQGVWTAIGCISREPEEIVGKFIRVGLSMGGGVALLMILSAGFTLTISQGNPQKAGQAKEMMTAAVTGLLFIIFSITILQFIGFSILKIPGFGGP